MAFKKQNLYLVIMILCFVYGGVCLLFSGLQILPIDRSPTFKSFVVSSAMSEISDNQSSKTFGNQKNENHKFARYKSRIDGIKTIILSISLFGAAISILAGVSILLLIRKKEKKK